MAQTLAECGVRYVFGLPGGEIAPFIESCRKTDLRFLLTGHETSAALIAQVLGQITGTPGVCLSTLGPGATNLVTGVANAYLDRSPLLAVVAQIPQASYANMTHQRLGIEALFAPITKRCVTVGSGDSADLIRNSLSVAMAPRPGPVTLVLPSDVANQTSINHVKNTKAAPTITRAKTADSLVRIADRITRSRRPLLLIGLGCPPGSAATVRTLVESLQAPFMVTPKAKGIVPEDHPLFLGVASGMALDRDILETIRAADLILGIGFDPVEVDKTWFTEVEVVAIDSVSMAEGDYHPIEVIGELELLVQELNNHMTQPRSWTTDLVDARRQALKRLPQHSNRGVSTLGLIEGLRSAFPRNGIVSCDVGSHKALMGQFWRSYEPGTFFMSNGLSGMGFGIPAAIAAQLAYPDRSVMAVVGDGGMLMMTHDLVLIRELGLPIVIVVLADNSLSLIRVAQERRGYPPCGVDFAGPDFAAVARAFGIRGERAVTIKDAQAALQCALDSRSSLLLEVPVDLREYYDLV